MEVEMKKTVDIKLYWARKGEKKTTATATTTTGLDRDRP